MLSTKTVLRVMHENVLKKIDIFTFLENRNLSINLYGWFHDVKTAKHVFYDLFSKKSGHFFEHFFDVF